MKSKLFETDYKPSQEFAEGLELLATLPKDKLDLIAQWINEDPLFITPQVFQRKK